MTGPQPAPRRVVFVGVGALGSAAVLLSRNFDAELVLVDGDRVEAKNVLAQAHVRASIGKIKAEALRLQLLNLYGVRSVARPVMVTSTNIDSVCADASLLVDAVDNAATRNLLAAYATASATPLVHAGISADGTFGLIRWNARFVADEEDEAGQATCEGGEHLPMVGLVGAALALTIQEHMAVGDCRDRLVTPGGVQVFDG